MNKAQSQKFRISINRSNRYVSAQIVDDILGRTLASVSPSDTKSVKSKNDQTVEAAKQLAKKAKELKIENVYFDRRSYRYQGRVKLFAETLRQEGLAF